MTPKMWAKWKDYRLYENPDDLIELFEMLEEQEYVPGSIKTPSSFKPAMMKYSDRESKRFAEAATQSYVTTHNLHGSIARIFNTYGPKMAFDDGRVVTNFIHQAITNQDITIFGDGSQTRSFSFIEDTLDGIMKILNHESSDVFNIGNDYEITINDLANKVIHLTKSNSKIINKDLPIDDPKQRKPDLSKARKILGYEPKYDLETGLKETISWFQENYK